MDIELFDPLQGFRDLLKSGPLEGAQAGWVKDGNCWHKAYYRKVLTFPSKQRPAISQLGTLSACRTAIGTPQVWAEPLDNDLRCSDCEDPSKCPPLCTTCDKPECRGVH